VPSDNVGKEAPGRCVWGNEFSNLQSALTLRSLLSDQSEHQESSVKSVRRAISEVSCSWYAVLSHSKAWSLSFKSAYKYAIP
jgi:hypothetical protein